MIVAGILEYFRKKAPYAGYGIPPAECCSTCSFFTSDLSKKCSPTTCPGSTNLPGGGTIENWKTCEYNSACAGYNGYQPLNDLSIWYQIIPYMFVGLGEIFTSISAYE